MAYNRPYNPDELPRYVAVAIELLVHRLTPSPLGSLSRKT